MLWKLACETGKASPQECMKRKGVACCYNGEHCIALEIPLTPHGALRATGKIRALCALCHPGRKRACWQGWHREEKISAPSVDMEIVVYYAYAWKRLSVFHGAPSPVSGTIFPAKRLCGKDSYRRGRCGETHVCAGPGLCAHFRRGPWSWGPTPVEAMRRTLWCAASAAPLFVEKDFSTFR